MLILLCFSILTSVALLVALVLVLDNKRGK